MRAFYRLAALACAAITSCLVTPKDYPVGDLEGRAGGGRGGNGGSAAGGVVADAGAAGDVGDPGNAGAPPTTGGSGGTGAISGSSGTSGSAGSAGAADGGTTGAAGTAGEAGAPAAGSGGSGGSGSGCVGLPDRSSWIATASLYSNPSPPQNAIDGEPVSRFSTGSTQDVGHWFQIDFGQSVSFDHVLLHQGDSQADYPRGYEVTVSDTPNDTAGTPAVSGQGSPLASLPIDFETTVSGRYLLIELTITYDSAWWSIHDIDLVCD